MQTTISDVTVFRDGARVTRSGTVQLDPGPQKVLVSGITDYAQTDSFRVKGTGPAKLSSIDVKSKSKVYEPSSDVKPILEKLKKLEKDLYQTYDDIELFTKRLTDLRTAVAGFSEHFGMFYAADEGNLANLTELDDTSEKMILGAIEDLRKSEEKRDDLENEIQVLKDNLSRVQGERRTETFYEVEITLEVTQKADVGLDVTYQCGGAGWSSSYDVDLLPGTANVRRVAMVRNSTKEGWDKVNLIVSTATARPVEAVEGSPFMIYAYDPSEMRDRPKAKKSGRMRGMEKEEARPPPAPAMAPGGLPAEEPVPMVEVFAEASETVSGIAIYELPKPVTIPEDGETHPITLTEEEFETKTLHYWYTDGMAEVVAQDEVKNGDSVLLPGSVKIYAEGDYIGETSIAMISPREKFKLGTRVAYDVKAKKMMVSREVEKAGMTRGKLRRSYKYRLEIESFAKKPIEIQIYDRVPHSLNPAIEVKIDWEKLGLKSNELGIMEWETSIQPGAKREIEYEYEVQWEKDVIVSPPLP
ncbi:MAG: mucoidy inhibitor MuiA family protein [Candidatus Thorarchaeota archaeon]